MINLLNGDCLELMKSIPDGSVDLILTDPPYGTTACKWDSIIPLEPMWVELKRVIKPNRAIVLFGSQPFTSILISSNLKMFKYDWVWNKKNGGSGLLAKYQPLRIYESILVFSSGGRAVYNPQMTVGKLRNKKSYGSKVGSAFGEIEQGKDNYNNRYFPKNIIEFSNANQKNKMHPTQKPVALMEYLIKTYSNEGDTVLDFTMGSGSTGVAAVNTGRKFIGIELDKDYFEIAQKRINEALEQVKDNEL